MIHTLVDRFDGYEGFDQAVSERNAVKARMSKIEMVFHTQYEKNYLYLW